MVKKIRQPWIYSQTNHLLSVFSRLTTHLRGSRRVGNGGDFGCSRAPQRGTWHHQVVHGMELGPDSNRSLPLFLPCPLVCVYQKVMLMPFTGGLSRPCACTEGSVSCRVSCTYHLLMMGKEDLKRASNRLRQAILMLWVCTKCHHGVAGSRLSVTYLFPIQGHFLPFRFMSQELVTGKLRRSFGS